MFAIDVTLNLFVLAGIVLVSLLLGWMIRRSQIKSLNKKIVELEKEMLSNHAEILDLQKNKALLERNLEASKIPVIPLNPSKDENADKHSEKSIRK